METKIIKDSAITRAELKALAHEQYGDVIKAVVDVKQNIMGVGGELHVDIESLLIQQENSSHEDTWGINLYLDKTGDDFLEFDSMINLKPFQNNKSRNVESEEIQNKIRTIVKTLVK